MSLVAGSSASLVADSGVAAYLEGLDAVDAGRFADAAKSFTRAIEAEDENTRYYLARGVSYVLSEQAEPARIDLSRANKLNGKDPAVSLWVWGWKTMYDEGRKHLAGPPPYKTTEPYGKELIAAAIRYGTPGNEQIKRDAYRKIVEVGRAWSAREQAQPDLLPAMMTRIEPLYRAGDFSRCLALIDRLRPANPKDAKLLAYSGHCKLGLKRWREARADYTQLLFQSPSSANILLGRSRAAMRMSSLDSAKEDLALVEHIGGLGEHLESTKKEFAQIAARSPKQSPAELAGVLKRDAPRGATLVQAVDQLVRADAATRFFPDEAFTRGVGRRQVDSDRQAGNIDRLVELAAYCLRPSEVRVVRQSADGKTTTIALKHQDMPRARRAVEKALAMDGNHVGALIELARIHRQESNFPVMIQAVEKAMAAGGNTLDLAVMYLEYYQWMASRLMLEASGLRMPGTSYETTGGVRYKVTTPAGPAAVAKAEELERKASAYSAQALGPIKKFRQAHGKTVIGHMAGAWQSFSVNELTTAATEADAALKLDPFNYEAIDFLATLSLKINQQARGEELADLLDNLQNPSAKRTLHRTWPLAQETRWTSAQQVIDEAEAKDPAALLVQVYRAAFFRASEKRDAADAPCRIGLAMCEAQVKLHGATLDATAAEPLSVDEAVMPMLLRLMLARDAAAAKRMDEAVSELQAMQALGSRVRQGDLLRVMTEAALPASDVANPKGAAVNGLRLASHMDAAVLLFEMGKYEEAALQLEVTETIPRPSALGPLGNADALTLFNPIIDKIGESRASQIFSPPIMQFHAMEKRRQPNDGSPPPRRRGRTPPSIPGRAPSDPDETQKRPVPPPKR